jgi:hypothetical protein
VDRGLFLLTVGHAAMIGTHAFLYGSFRWLLITDAVGFNMIVGSWLFTRLSRRERLLLSFGLYVTSWAALVWWHPDGRWERLFSNTFFGQIGDGFWLYSFPLLPWFALYLASTVLGERIGASLARNDQPDVSRTLGMVGLSSLGLACLLMIGTSILGGYLSQPSDGTVAMLGSIFQKVPPSPAYVLFFGGVGLALISAFYLMEQRGVAKRLVAVSSVIGQSSLFVFVLQFYVYYVGLPLLGIRVGAFWPVYMVLTIVATLAAAIAFHRRGYRRFITVGYPHAWRSAVNSVDAQVHRLPASVGILAAMLWSGRH